MKKLLFFFMLFTAYAASAEPVRVFIFAGQSNMVGSDSKVKDIQKFPPFRGLENPQANVRFSYVIGRENKNSSNGWVDLQHVKNVVGPELSFGRRVSQVTGAPIAIIKVAAGGTTLGGDWNPDEPQGFKLYPLLLEHINKALADLKKKGLKYSIEGFMWHQGENDMFKKDYLPAYGKNLINYMAKIRRDLKTPNLNFYIGGLNTKSIWGMDLRPRMYAIYQGQKTAVKADKLATYIPNSMIGVELSKSGLHYHYGTLGQLQHGENYARAYLKKIGKFTEEKRSFSQWPYKKGEKVKLFVLAGQRNMEGERAFTADLGELKEHRNLLKDDTSVAFKYNLGGDYKVSNGWEPLGLLDYYETFGPELSFAAALKEKSKDRIAVAKFTHSGATGVDWRPSGSNEKGRDIYKKFVTFITESIKELEEKGQQVELAGVFFHIGENDMALNMNKKPYVKWMEELITGARKDLNRQDLKWFFVEQKQLDYRDLMKYDIVPKLKELADKSTHTRYISTTALQTDFICLRAENMVKLGELMARESLKK